MNQLIYFVLLCAIESYLKNNLQGCRDGSVGKESL